MMDTLSLMQYDFEKKHKKSLMQMYLIICHINHTKILMFKYDTTPQKELEYKMQFMIKKWRLYKASSLDVIVQ